MTEPRRDAAVGTPGRGEAYRLKAKASQATGHHADALEALRHARRLRPPSEGPQLALAEADALMALNRYRDAVTVASRALAQRRAEPDLTARLRLIRGQGLWLTGPPGRAEGELRKAAGQATAPLTRARILEAQALFAWKSQDLPQARAHLAAARDIYAAHGALAGLGRVLEREASLLRDAGEVEAALAAHDDRLALARRLGRPDAVALARADRGSTLAALGRWEDAGREFDAAAAAFQELGDPREHTAARAGRVVVDLAAGDLPRARAALDRARELNAERGNTRSLAENLLYTSDLHLAAGEPEAAERTAVESLGLYRLLKDDEGECRARVRRAHALVALGRAAEAARESGRARRAAGEGRRELEAFAFLALGRALLRLDTTAAASAFETAFALGRGQGATAHAARLGLAGARGALRDSHEVLHAVAALEAWGDRRILAYGLADVREILGTAPGVRVAETSAAGVAATPALTAMVDAAAALLGEGVWSERWAGAMRAVRGVIPWCRAVLVGRPGWELRMDEPLVRPLAASDLARDVAAVAPGPARIDLRAHPEWRDHPTRALRSLSVAFLVPVVSGLALYVDLKEDARPVPDDTTVGLLAELGRLLACHAPSGADEETPPSFAGIIGGCPPMIALFRKMARVAPSELAVHVSGETGTGKERVAEALHRHSPRASGPFVAVNASSLSDELFESEMFGHVRGSFTGAVGDREGYVATAEGGTLFLDEVTDLSARAQAKLLRFLERREYRRVGESRLRRADVRIVSAANLPLEARLRPDLVFRLKDVVLSLPALRERGDDVLVLANEFLRREAPSGRSAPTLGADARRALQGYGWPGNVRELQREIRRAVVLAGAATIRAEHLSVGGATPDSPSARRPLKDAVLGFEREYVGAALRELGGNRARTAVVLGISRQALVAKIARLGLG